MEKKKTKIDYLWSSESIKERLWSLLLLLFASCKCIVKRINLPSRHEVGNHPSYDATLTADLHVAKIWILYSRFLNTCTSPWRVWISWWGWTREGQSFEFSGCLFSSFYQAALIEFGKNMVLKNLGRLWVVQFLKSFNWKDDRSLEYQGVWIMPRAVCITAFFKGKGQNILRVPFSLMLLFILMLCCCCFRTQVLWWI